MKKKVSETHYPGTIMLYLIASFFPFFKNCFVASHEYRFINMSFMKKKELIPVPVFVIIE